MKMLNGHGRDLRNEGFHTAPPCNVRIQCLCHGSHQELRSRPIKVSVLTRHSLFEHPTRYGLRPLRALASIQATRSGSPGYPNQTRRPRVAPVGRRNCRVIPDDAHHVRAADRRTLPRLMRTRAGSTNSPEATAPARSSSGTRQVQKLARRRRTLFLILLHFVESIQGCTDAGVALS